MCPQFENMQKLIFLKDVESDQCFPMLRYTRKKKVGSSKLKKKSKHTFMSGGDLQTVNIYLYSNKLKKNQ